MAAITMLSLKNDNGDEVDFIPSKIDAQTGVVSYGTQAESFDRRSVATISVALPRSSGTRVRVKGKVTIPVMDSLDNTKRVDEEIGTFEFSLSKNGSLETRRHLLAHIKDFVSDAVVSVAVANFESPY